MDGTTSMKKRTDTVNAFRSGGRDDPRVLIMSAVGLVGLNVADANYMVMLVSASHAVSDRTD